MSASAGDANPSRASSPVSPWLEEVEVCLRQEQCPLSQRVMAASPELVDDGAAADLDLREMDGVVPELVDQIGLADDAGEVADDGTGEPGEVLAQPAVDEL